MTQPDELIDFIHLKSRRGLTQLELEDEVATDLQKATGIVDTAAANSANLKQSASAHRSVETASAERHMNTLVLCMYPQSISGLIESH